jgi:hypothetical protein
LFIKLLLLSPGEFLAMTCRHNAGAKPVQQMAHLIQSKAAGLRQSQHSEPLNTVSCQLAFSHLFKPLNWSQLQVLQSEHENSNSGMCFSSLQSVWAPHRTTRAGFPGPPRTYRV